MWICFLDGFSVQENYFALYLNFYLHQEKIMVSWEPVFSLLQIFFWEDGGPFSYFEI